jgi:hypothetical protein
VIIQIKGKYQVCCAKIKIIKIKQKIWIYDSRAKKFMKPHILKRIPWVPSFVGEETPVQHLIVDVPVLHFALHTQFTHHYHVFLEMVFLTLSYS